MTVIDFFCGAGGFSQGFKQLGLKILYGYDYWEPAVKTFNYNYNLQCKRTNILNFKDNIEEINNIPNSNIIIGSPPCVSFSSSNKSGKADKALGIKLTETFLQIVAIKKFQPNSVLKAWYMENVANSYKYLKGQYSFTDLNLKEWAIKNNLNPDSVAIQIENNYEIINSLDFGSFQNRKRFITGEIINQKCFISPEKVKLDNRNLKNLKENFVNPFDFKDLTKKITDPNYPIEYKLDDIADHFYDTGIHDNNIKFAKFLKTNHPYMGKMAFPENENKPSRTITATLISNSREAIIYKSEIERNNGKYRSPTVREAAIIMGFPINYQFTGKYNTKYKLVGNAVCVEVSRNLAKVTLKNLKKPITKKLFIDNRIIKIDDLNTYKINSVFKKIQKKSNAKFRWHIVKDGNITVSLTNFNPIINDKIDLTNLRWYTSIQYGTGDGFPNEIFNDHLYIEARKILNVNKKTKFYIENFENKIYPKIGNSTENQTMFTNQENIKAKIELSELLIKMNHEINDLNISDILVNCANIFSKKPLIPLSQVLCFFIINKISSKLNNHDNN